MKKINHQVIDNFLSETELNQLKEKFNNEPTWILDNFDDVDIFLEKKIYENNSPVLDFYNDLVPLLQKIQVLGLIEIGSNLYLREKYIKTIKKEKKYKFNHGTAIYYLNSNDGYTLLDDGTKVQSVENRILIFESEKDYYETNCTDSRCRINITFNYL